MALLEPIAEHVWSVARPLRFLGVETGTRMNVVRLAAGDLFVHSPVPLGAELRVEVDALGAVRAVVAPSLFHHLSVAAWKDAYPKAVIACCPGLERKRADVAWDRVLGDSPEPEWAAEIEQVYFGARWLENEVVFFHPRSRTMMCADAIFNLSGHRNRLTRVVAAILGNREPGATWLERIMIRDRAAAREQVGRMIAWSPERILLAHGPNVENGAAAILRRAYAWL